MIKPTQGFRVALHAEPNRCATHKMHDLQAHVRLNSSDRPVVVKTRCDGDYMLVEPPEGKRLLVDIRSDGSIRVQVRLGKDTVANVEPLTNPSKEDTDDGSGCS